MKNKTMKIITVFAVIFSLLIVSVLTSCGKKQDAGKVERRVRVYAVVADTVEAATLQNYLNQNGEITAKTNIAVYGEISGKIASLSVEVGDAVVKNQIIAQIDPSKPGSYYSLSPVKAPISGTVTEIVSRPGTTVSTSTAIVKIGDIKDLVVYVNIPERDVGNLKLGLKADVTLPAFPDEIFAAEVTRVSPVLDPVSRSKQIELSFLKYDPRLNSGMFPKVKLYTTVYENIIVVPADVIVTRAEKNYVFLVAKNDKGAAVAKRTEIKMLLTIDEQTIVSEGLSAGDTMVVQGMDALTDGAILNVLAE